METDTIPWHAFAALIERGKANWNLLIGEELENRALGPGKLIRIEGRFLWILFASGAPTRFAWRQPNSELAPLDQYFKPLPITEALRTTLDEIASEEMAEVRRRLLAAEAQHRIAEADRLRRQEAEAQEQERRSVLENSVEAWQIVVRQAMGDRIHAYLLQPALDTDDVRLAVMWTRKHVDGPSGRSKLTRLSAAEQLNVRRSVRAKMLSARAAEKAVAQFYRTRGKDVTDISIQQLDGAGKSDWCTHDLLVDGRPFDVKNARRSWKDKEIYVEHCVPQFKENRAGDDVRIVGLLSPYIKYAEFERLIAGAGKTEGELCVLGETTRGGVQRLQETFNRAGLFEIALDRKEQPWGKRLPPWMFDYPSECYPGRSRALDQIYVMGVRPDLVWSAVESRSRLQLLPLLLAAGLDLTGTEHGVAPWERDFVLRVGTWVKRLGLSLPFLFCSILLHFLEMTSKTSVPVEYSPAGYKRLIFPDLASRDRPLFIFDPLSTVYTLIDSLETLWQQTKIASLGYTSYKLVGLNFLRARRDEPGARWEMILAYCGGWIEGKGKCGKSPLVLGKSSLCSTCGHLICPDPECGFCHEKCPRYAAVKSARAKQQEEYPGYTEAQREGAYLPDESIDADEEIPF